MLMLWDLKYNRSPRHGQPTKPIDSKKKQVNQPIEDFAVPTDHRVKLTRSENEGYVKFRVHLLGKGMCPLIITVMFLIVPLLFV